MNEIVTENDKKIENMIYEIRGKQVMLDSDLAKLYECKNGTKEINQAVKNNIIKFPERFSWVLNKTELDELRSKYLTTNYSKMSRSNPRVFTEQGVAMLATILKSKVAIEVSIKIMDAFVIMRKYFAVTQNNNEILLNHENRLLNIENTIKKMKTNEKINKIFFAGQIYDAYSILIKIFNKAQKEIIIIDNYAGKELLDILREINIPIIIVSSNINEVLKNKYTSQYSNIIFYRNNSFHDRFIILDRKQLYSCGASFKDLGKKCFAINEIDSNKYIIDIIIAIEMNINDKRVK